MVVIAEISLIELSLDELGIDAQVTYDGVLLEEPWHGRLSGGLLDQSAQGAVAEEAVLQGVAARPVHAFTWVVAGQADQSLQQPVRTHATLDDHRLGPGQRVWTDVFGLGEQNSFIRGLT